MNVMLINLNNASRRLKALPVTFYTSFWRGVKRLCERKNFHFIFSEMKTQTFENVFVCLISKTLF